MAPELPHPNPEEEAQSSQRAAAGGGGQQGWQASCSPMPLDPATALASPPHQSPRVARIHRHWSMRFAAGLGQIDAAFLDSRVTALRIHPVFLPGAIENPCMFLALYAAGCAHQKLMPHPLPYAFSESWPHWCISAQRDPIGGCAGSTCIYRHHLQPRTVHPTACRRWHRARELLRYARASRTPFRNRALHPY